MKRGGRASRGKEAGWLLALLAALAGAQLYAFHWGVITPDTIFQWSQVVSGRYDNWHPPATTWAWRQLSRLGPGTAPILIFDIALYWTGVWLIAATLWRERQRWAAGLALLCAASPIPFGQMGAILKDPLLCACCLVASGLLLASRRHSLRPLAFAVALALLLFASATRFNAVAATAPLLAGWAPRRWLSGPARLLATLAGSAALLGLGGWAIDAVALHPQNSEPIYSLVNFDLGGIAAHGGRHVYPNLDQATETRMTALCYTPSLYNPADRTDCDDVEGALRDYAHAHRRSAVSIWLEAVARAPLPYLRHRLAHLNRNLRFAVPGVPDDAIYMMSTPNPYGLDFRANAVTRGVLRAARMVAPTPLGRPATWMAVALGLLAISGRLGGARGFVTAVSASVLLYGLAYAVASVAPDMRYNFWTMLGAMMALAVAAGDLRERRWLGVALIPAVVAALIELAALA
ncbi:hypothetical protein [Sphingomonas quercus]|uniref:Glycosyltransferase RgtA/B/C/D-like domain-containing protein n=1 Tax=Sphingomonas quercus TaxID=2842451 RepID=A0ABS6BK05_9SPHN|nr:hypothetical protein [Sphingomonas quercus]MBU3078633.1 hypothetical protein [Sphingomonas quercus]